MGITQFASNHAPLARRDRFLDEHCIRVNHTVGVNCQRFGQFFKMARQVQVVVVQINNIATMSQAQRSIAGSRWAAITTLTDISDRKLVLSQQRFNRVAVVIDQDDLEVLAGLPGDAVKRIPEQCGTVVGCQDNRKQRLLLLSRLPLQSLAKLTRPGPQLGLLLAGVQIQAPLEVRRHLALTPVEVMLRVALEDPLENGKVSHQWLAGGIELVRVLRAMPTIADTRRINIGEIGMALRHLHDHFPVTGTVAIAGIPHPTKNLASVDHGRRGHIAVVNQQVSDLIATAEIIAIAVSRVTRLVQRLSGAIDPAYAGIANRHMGLALQCRQQTRQMARVEIIVSGQKCEIAPLRDAQAISPVIAWAVIVSVAYVAHPRIARECRHYLGGIVRGCVVQHQDLDIVYTLFEHRLNTLGEITPIVVGGDNHT
ncbi:hypothetical protein BC89_19830 [Pseudomonas monteilii]|nr:hypothetical protein BC89_19830 [Pseudomonas monteilii]